jgi:hypothetical protein
VTLLFITSFVQNILALVVLYGCETWSLGIKGGI